MKVAAVLISSWLIGYGLAVCFFGVDAPYDMDDYPCYTYTEKETK